LPVICQSELPLNTLQNSRRLKESNNENKAIDAKMTNKQKRLGMAILIENPE
jgi:hypothetical protein